MFSHLLPSRAPLALAVAVLAPAMAFAQPRVSTRKITLVGSVRDSLGQAIPNVEVWLHGANLYARTNAAGGFRIPDAPSGPASISLRRLGFEQAIIDVNLKAEDPDSLVIALTAIAATLPGITVEEEARNKRILAGFWDRRTKGLGGHFLTRQEIEDRRAHDFVDLVRTTPGLNVVNVGGRPQLRLRNSNITRGDCPPYWWVDGMHMEGATGEEFPPSTLEAVEIYNGVADVPLQFQPKTVGPRFCGVIVIWTHLPGT